jgi:hypothetical protein
MKNFHYNFAGRQAEILATHDTLHTADMKDTIIEYKNQFGGVVSQPVVKVKLM